MSDPGDGGEAEDRCVALRYPATELNLCKWPTTSKPSG